MQTHTLMNTYTDTHTHKKNTYSQAHMHACIQAHTLRLTDASTPSPTVTFTHVKEEEKNTESGRKVGEAGVERVGGKRRELCNI